jgi:hypothetical protein
MADITQEFLDVISRATPSDIEFSEETFPSHSPREKNKVGFRPVRVLGVETPKSLPVTYVQGEDERGIYWYVVSGIGSLHGRPREFPAASDNQARAAVLEELRIGALGS